MTSNSNLTRRDLLVGTVAASSLWGLDGASAADSAPIKSAPPIQGATRMDIERFVDDCVAAHREADAQAAVLEVLARAVRDADAVLAALGEPTRAGIDVLHRSKTLTIFSATWTPQMNLMPHNHRMWANIGIYTGREDNILWRGAEGRIEAHGARALFRGDAVALPPDVIHSVTNPLPRYTGGIHIYGGDFFDTTRSQWNPETLAEEPSDGAVIAAIFKRENERVGRCGPA
jgi:predicted metal-dependent enzyme (double-stranded beta helix superfamily)